MNEAVFRSILHRVREAKQGTEARPKNKIASGEGDPFPTLRAWVVDREVDEKGKLRAVLICSAILEDHLWVICDRSFEPRDGLAVYYAEEMAALRNKTPEDIREIHKVKLVFPGCRIIQEGAK